MHGPGGGGGGLKEVGTSYVLASFIVEVFAKSSVRVAVLMIRWIAILWGCAY